MLSFLLMLDSFIVFSGSLEWHKYPPSNPSSFIYLLRLKFTLDTAISQFDPTSQYGNEVCPICSSFNFYVTIYLLNRLVLCSFFCVCFCCSFFVLFLAFDLCGFCVVIRFFHPATTANNLRLRRIIYPRFYPLHLFSYLNS